MGKRALAVFMAMVLAFGMMPAPSWAAGDAGGSVSLQAAATESLMQGNGFSVPSSLPDGVSVTSERVGIGGGGALFDPAMSPFDPNDMAVGTDMGDLYVTRDGGGSWVKKTVGRVYDIQYDPTREGCVYACGSGIWRSTDYGESFELMWPKAEHVNGEPTKYEQARYYLFNTDGYDPYSQVKSIAVDPADNRNLYALATGYPSGFILYRSTDGGATFAEIARQGEDRRSIDSNYDKSKLVVHDGACWLCTQAGIFAYDGTSALSPVYEPAAGCALIDVDQVESDGADGLEAGVYYWVAEGTEAGTATPATTISLMHMGAQGKLAAVADRSFDTASAKAAGLDLAHSSGEIPLRIQELAAVSTVRTYFYVYTTGGDNSVLGRYDAAADAPFRWVFGYRLNDSVPYRFDLQNLSHADGYVKMWGIAASPAAPNRFLLATGFGAYGSPDCEVAFEAKNSSYPRRSNVYQLYSNLHASASVPGHAGNDKYTYSSTGIDNVTTYGVRVDPFDGSHVAMLNTDFGLTLSNDSGATWSRSRSMNNNKSGDEQRKLPDAWSNTAYDLAFDRYKQGRVYSLWSGRHDAPYATSPAEDAKALGGFAVADVDETGWSSLTAGWSKADGSKLYSTAGDTALPANVIPVRLGVVYPADAAKRAADTDRTFWVAGFGGGFFRSTDSGSTFEAVNGGIDEKTDGMIYAADLEVAEDGSQVFGMTARRTDKSIGGKVYRWNAGAQAWDEIPLPEGVGCPRDIHWDAREETLYISCVAANSWKGNGGDASMPDFHNHHGGLFTWHVGDDAATALDASSAVVGDSCSIEGAVTDSAGNLYVSDARGSVFLRRAGQADFEKIYDRFHVSGKGVQLVGESVSDGGAHTDDMALPSFGGGLLWLAVRFAPDDEGPGFDPDSGQVSDSELVASVKAAADAAVAYSGEQGFASTALKDVFEMKLPESLCYSVGEGVYHVLYGGGYYAFAVDDGKVASASAVGRDDRLPVFDTLADAEADLGAAPAAFITRGRNVAGDKGHGYYEKVASLAAGQPGFTARRLSYALTSAESAVNPYQLDYVDDADDAGNSANAAIDAFHASGFHTLVFPPGDYRLAADVWSNRDDRSYYGLGATLYTDGAIALSSRNSGHNSLWVVRGDFAYNGSTETYVDDAGGTVKKNVFHTVRNVEFNGLRLERRTGTSGYNRMVSVRHARNVAFDRCAFDGITCDDAMPTSGDVTSSPGAIVDFYGNYDNVSFVNSTIAGESAIDIRDLCDHVDNIPKSMQVDDDNPTGGRNVVVRNNDITTYNFDEGLPIFAGNEQGLGTWKDGVFTEYPTLTHCLVENVLVENNRYTMREPQTVKQRVVPISCGYQDSPVRNVVIQNNVFDVCANNYLILFGYAEDCRFTGNDVILRRTVSDSQLHELVYRSYHTRTGPTKDVCVSGNTIVLPQEDATLGRMVGADFGPEAVSFTDNDVTVAGTVERVFDSTATCTGNTFHLNHAKHLYDRVGEVANNVYDIERLDTLYESYGTNAGADLNIHGEKASIGLYTSKYLFSFNGDPKYNGHSITLENCSYDAAELSETYPRIAWSTDGIVDSVTLNLDGCDISWFTSRNNYAISNDAGKKVALAVYDPVYGSISVAAMRADTALAAGDVVKTRAYYAGGTADDPTAGAGTYDIESHADWQASKDDGGRFIRLGNGSWAVLRLDEENPAVDLYQYGAYGDDSHDDSTAVDAALNSGAETVHVSAGTYLTRQVDVSLENGAAPGLAIEGDSEAACTLKLRRPPDLYPESTYVLLSFTRMENLALKNIGLCADTRANYYASRSDPSATRRNGKNDFFNVNHVQLWYCDGVELDHVRIADTMLDDAAEMLDVNTGVKFIGTNGLDIHDCAFSNTDCGIITQGSALDGSQDCDGITIRDNVFDGHLYSEAVSFFADGPKYTHITISGNTMKNKTHSANIFLGDLNDQFMAWPASGRVTDSDAEGYVPYSTFEDVLIEGNVAIDNSNCITLNHATRAVLRDNESVRSGALFLRDCEDVKVEGHKATDVAQMALLMEWGNRNVEVTGLDVNGFDGVVASEHGTAFPAISLSGAAENVKVSGHVDGLRNVSHDAAGVNVTGSGYDVSGLTFELHDDARALNVYEGVTATVFHTSQPVLVNCTADWRANDIVVDAAADVSIEVSVDDSSGTRAFLDPRAQSYFERFSTVWNATWRNWGPGTALAFMDPCQDGFVRTLTVSVPADSPTAGLLKDGDGSEGSITWIEGPHEIARGQSLTYQLVCEGGVWRELEREHKWGEPIYEWSSDNSLVKARTACVYDASHAITETVSTAYSVTEEPSATASGVGIYTAKFTDEHFSTQVKTVVIPATRSQFNPTPTALAFGENQVASGGAESRLGMDGTAFGRGASGEALEAGVSALRSDADPTGTSFYVLRARLAKAGKTSVKLRWAKAKGAARYAVYAAKSGRAHRFSRVATVKAASFTHKRLKSAASYKYLVVALDAAGDVVSSSKVVHVSTSGKKLGNAKAVRISGAKNSKVTLKRGASLKLRASQVVPAGLKAKSLRKLKWESSDPSVATVSAKGKVKGRAKGVCRIYAYAQDGAFDQVKVTVR